MSWTVWITIFGVVLVFTFLTTKMASRSSEDNLHDMGLAILEFGRAFPGEAIRDLHATRDGNTVFVRLHDNKAGFMRNMRGHYSCHLIEPGGVRVRPLGNDLGLVVEFLEFPLHDGSFEFASPKEAAEVALWLLGNFVSPGDKAALANASA